MRTGGPAELFARVGTLAALEVQALGPVEIPTDWITG